MHCKSHGWGILHPHDEDIWEPKKIEILEVNDDGTVTVELNSDELEYIGKKMKKQCECIKPCALCTGNGNGSIVDGLRYAEYHCKCPVHGNDGQDDIFDERKGLVRCRDCEHAFDVHDSTCCDGWYCNCRYREKEGYKFKEYFGLNYITERQCDGFSRYEPPTDHSCYTCAFTNMGRKKRPGKDYDLPGCYVDVYPDKDSYGACIDHGGYRPASILKKNVSEVIKHRGLGYVDLDDEDLEDVEESEKEPEKEPEWAPEERNEKVRCFDCAHATDLHAYNGKLCCDCIITPLLDFASYRYMSERYCPHYSPGEFPPDCCTNATDCPDCAFSDSNNHEGVPCGEFKEKYGMDTTDDDCATVRPASIWRRDKEEKTVPVLKDGKPVGEATIHWGDNKITAIIDDGTFKFPDPCVPRSIGVGSFDKTPVDTLSMTFSPIIVNKDEKPELYEELLKIHEKKESDEKMVEDKLKYKKCKECDKYIEKAARYCPTCGKEFVRWHEKVRWVLGSIPARVRAWRENWRAKHRDAEIMYLKDHIKALQKREGELVEENTFIRGRASELEDEGINERMDHIEEMSFLEEKKDKEIASIIADRDTNWIPLKNALPISFTKIGINQHHEQGSLPHPIIDIEARWTDLAIKCEPVTYDDPSAIKAGNAWYGKSKVNWVVFDRRTLPKKEENDDEL
jgi:hypothetical protein